MNIRNLAAAAALCGSLQLAAGWETGGFVFCDSNQNGQIDSGDTPMPGVLVVVTNVSGTFSNAAWTGLPDGGFVLDLPPMADSYVEYLHPLTLPGDATVVVPAGGVYTFTLDGVTTSNFLGNFLVSSTNCASAPPPPTTQTNGCCLKAEGIILGSGGPFQFEGSVNPPCDGSTNGDTGEWDIRASNLKLHFQGSVFETVSCGVMPGPTNGCTLGFIEFQGAGTLKGTCGSQANFGVVYFYGRAEQGCKCAGIPDALYFRVYAADNTPLLLISADQNNPLNIAPVALCAGHICVSTNCCHASSEGEENEDHHEHGEQGHGDKGHHNGGGNHGEGNHGQGDHGNCSPGSHQQGNGGKGQAEQGHGNQSHAAQSHGNAQHGQSHASGNNANGKGGGKNSGNEAHHGHG